MADYNSSAPDFTPYVPANKTMKELTFKSLFPGVLLAIILDSANAYPFLNTGMKVAAAFPAVVIALVVLRILRGTILEENVNKITASIGEALAVLTIGIPFN